MIVNLSAFLQFGNIVIKLRTCVVWYNLGLFLHIIKKENVLLIEKGEHDIFWEK